MILNETFKMYNGVEIPKIGLGTWLVSSDDAEKSVRAALSAGYRHIDTAQGYQNEDGVGRAISESGIKREELFITTKIAARHRSYAAAAASIDESLEKLRTTYADMIIIHSPQPWELVNQSDDRFYEENAEIWRALEDAYEAKKVRAIGVSNFLIGDIENILKSCRIRPMSNQILAHIGNTPHEVIDFCKKHGILVEAYSPIAHGIAKRDSLIIKTAEKYGVSPSRLCIRYALQLGLVALPKSLDPDHMRENADADFVISDGDMKTLCEYDKLKDYAEFGNFPVYGGKK